MNTYSGELLEAVGTAIAAYGNKRYAEGLKEGLAVAEKVRAWLTRTPDTKWKGEVRKWADSEIEKKRKEIEAMEQ